MGCYALTVGYIKSNGDFAVKKLGAEEFYRFDPKHRQSPDAAAGKGETQDTSPANLGD